jgi:hypothetical protein
MQYKNTSELIKCYLCAQEYDNTTIISHLQSCSIQSNVEAMSDHMRDMVNDSMISKELIVKFAESQELKDFTNLNDLKNYILPFLNTVSDATFCTFVIINHFFKGEDIDIYRLSLLKTN